MQGWVVFSLTSGVVDPATVDLGSSGKATGSDLRILARLDKAYPTLAGHLFSGSAFALLQIDVWRVIGGAVVAS
jgi:hypothetical protein